MARRQADPGEDTPQIPEMEDKEDRPLINAARAMKKAQREFSAAGEEMKEAQDKVKHIMHERGITKYRYGSLVIELSTNEKLKVKMDED